MKASFFTLVIIWVFNKLKGNVMFNLLLHLFSSSSRCRGICATPFLREQFEKGIYFGNSIQIATNEYTTIVIDTSSYRESHRIYYRDSVTNFIDSFSIDDRRALWLEYRERSRALEWLKITENCQSLHEYSRSSIDRSIVNFESKQRELEKNNEYLELPINKPKKPKYLISNRYGTMTGYD